MDLLLEKEVLRFFLRCSALVLLIILGPKEACAAFKFPKEAAGILPPPRFFRKTSLSDFSGKQESEGNSSCSGVGPFVLFGCYVRRAGDLNLLFGPCLLSARHWKGNGEGGALSGLAFHLRLAIMAGDDAMRKT